MRRSCRNDSLLALLGMVAIAVYVLSCRPSFSPDGTKIAFPSFDSNAHQATVLCYDLKGKKLETIYQSALVDKVREPETPATTGQKKEAGKQPSSSSFDPSNEQYLLSVQWLPDGRRIAVNSMAHVLTLPIGAAGPVRLFQLRNLLDSGSLMRPMPVLGKYQFIADKEFLLRVNLDTGEMLAAADKKELMLIGRGSELYYVAAEDVLEKSGSSEARAQTMVIGRLNPETLDTTPLLKLNAEQFGDLTGFGAAAPDGTRLAFTTTIAKSPRLLLVRENRLEKTLALAKEDSGIKIGNVEWSANGKSLYVAYSRDMGKDVPDRYGVLEISAEGGDPREIPLFSGDSSDSWPAIFQIAVSPDGRTLAANSTCFEHNDLKDEDRALYLIDLGSAARKITKVPVPLETGGKASDIKK